MSRGGATHTQEDCMNGRKPAGMAGKRGGTKKKTAKKAAKKR